MHKIFPTVVIGLLLGLSFRAEAGPDYILNDVVVTATRFPQPATPGITVIGAAQIAASPASTLPELLAEEAGVHIRNADGSPDDSIDLRGFGASGNQNTLVLLDGQPLNEIELTDIPWSSIPKDSIQRIEIQRGSGAVLYGGGATGGVINIITKAPGTIRQGRAGVQAGSYNSRGGHLFLDHPGKALAYNLSASGLDSDNYRANNRIRLKNLDWAFRMPLRNGAVTLRLGGEDEDLGLPGPRSRTQLITDRRGTDTPRDFSTLNGTRAVLAWAGRAGAADLKVDLGWRKNRRNALYDDYSLDGFDAKAYIRTENQLLSLSPRLRLRHRLFGLEHELVIGLDWDDWDYGSHRYTGPETLPGNGSATTLAADISATQRNRAAYVRDEARLDPHSSLILGARIQRSEYSAHDAVSNAPYANGGTEHTLSAWDLEWTHDVWDGASFYARIGRSFRIPTVDEIYSQYGGPLFDPAVTLLKPQTSLDKEIGFARKRGATRWRAAVYLMDLRDEIHYNALTYANMNLSPTRRYGLELEARHTVTPTLSVHAAYTWSAAKFRQGVYGGVDVSGNDVPLVPMHMFSLGLDWHPSAVDRITAVARHTGSQRFDNDQANTFFERMPGYTVVDVKYTHDAGAWHLTAAVRNLLNKKYFSYGVASTTSDNFNAYPAPGRNFSLGAEYRF